MLDCGWLKDFVKLAEEGNFSRAAEARNLSQPALSRRIRNLEIWVGVTLVDRSNHRTGLTEAGSAFLLVAKEILCRLSLGRQEARSVGEDVASTLRFASTHGLSVTLFPEWLRAAGGEWEFNQISLAADNMAACERLMLEGAADFLLCHTHPIAPHRLTAPNFQSVLIGRDTLTPVSIAESDGSARFQLPGSADAPLPILECDDHSGMGRILTASGVQKAGGAALRPVFRSHLGAVLIALAREGRGLTWAPLSMVKDDLASGRLAQCGDERWNVPVEIRLYRPKARRSPAVERFWRDLPERRAA